MPLQLCQSTLSVICQDGSVWTMGDRTHLPCAPARKLRQGDAQTAKDGKRKTMAVCAANGPAHMGVVLDNGELLMRGEYKRGQLGLDPAWMQLDRGLGAIALSLQNVLVGEKVLQVACGAQHTAVVTSSQRIMTCGDNTFGQLGDRSPCPESEFTPRSPAWRHELDYVQLYPTDTWVYVNESTSILGSHDGCTGVVAAGDHCLAVTATGNVLAWGVGPPACNHRPTSVHGNAAPLGVLGTHARRVYFTTHMLPGLPGDANTADGVVHSGEIDYIWQRKEKMVFISTSESHAAAVDAHGLLWTWGEGHYGQLGHSENMPMCVHHCMPNSIWHPPSVPPHDCRQRASWHPSLPPIHHVSCSNRHTLAVTKDGMVWGWGDNKMRQLAGRNDDRWVEVNSGLVFTDAEIKTGITLKKNGTLSLNSSGEILLAESKFTGVLLVPIQFVPRALPIAGDTATASGSTGTASAHRYHAVGAAPSGSAAVDEHGQLVVWGTLWGSGPGCLGPPEDEARGYACKHSLFDGLRVGLGQGLNFELKLALCMGLHHRLGGPVAHVETGRGAHAHCRKKYMTLSNAKARLWHKLLARGWKQEMPTTLKQWGEADRWLMQQPCVLSCLDRDVLCRIVQHSNWSPTCKMRRCAGIMRAAGLA